MKDPFDNEPMTYQMEYNQDPPKKRPQRPVWLRFALVCLAIVLIGTAAAFLPSLVML